MADQAAALSEAQEQHYRREIATLRDVLSATQQQRDQMAATLARTERHRDEMLGANAEFAAALAAANRRIQEQDRVIVQQRALIEDSRPE